MSEYDSEDIDETDKTYEWKERKRIKDMFLKACEINDFDYVKENIEEQIIYKGRGLTLACKNRNIQVIEFLIGKGAFGCTNCRLKRVGFFTPWGLFCKKEKEKMLLTRPEMGFGEIASLLKTKWNNIKKDKTELEKYEKEATLINQSHLRCLRIK